VNALTELDPPTFVRLVQPLLERNDMPGLLAMLKQNWTKKQIVGLLSSKHCDARKVAALALSLVGCKACIPEIAEQLKDRDPMVNQMAEHALWSIWFRCGCDDANDHLARGSQAMNARQFEQAIEHFDHAIDRDPDFAEAYNQRAIVLYLQERFEESIKDCRRAAELMPCHFGAWAGMGHCYAHLGQLDAAKRAYQKALSLNPHLECISEAIEEIDRNMSH
jgi:tetratricopeptide (TPR) repeat protein